MRSSRISAMRSRPFWSARREISSRVKSSQVRKDLSYFGEFGKRGVGYRVADLLEQLAGIIGVDREWFD
jgi:redox-sensing transcriptional repressor